MLVLGVIGILVVVGGFLFPGALFHRFQQSDVDRTEFLAYKARAEKGEIYGQHNLGFCYELGRGVKSDPVEAMKWYRKAAEQNSAAAQFSLGFCYERGGPGVGKDYVEAYAWYYLAAKRDDTSANRCDYLKEQMSPQQIADAKKRTKELRAMIDAKLKSGGK